MKTAFICDWLTGMRGGERCLEAACELFPQADIFTLVHYSGSVSKTIESHNIYTSYIQNLPGNSKTFRRYLPFFPHAVERFDLNGYDCVLSFSHCIAKGAKVSKHAPHICYCHTPVRYAWHKRDDYLQRMSKPKQFIAGIILDHLKRWDLKTASRVTHFIANSINVKGRIKETYDRDSTVIYPPVDCDRFTISKGSEDYYLVISALVPYKKIDLAIKAFNGFSRKLLIVGNGPELSRLKDTASRNIIFIEKASDQEVGDYLQRCRALIFPGEEDFGIVPLEAQACGKAVIAFGKGGALETIKGLGTKGNPSKDSTGCFFYEPNADSLRQAVLFFEKNIDRIGTENCRQNALRFDRSIFKKSLKNHIDAAVNHTDLSVAD